jgi:DNA repair exonuclease SbcCD ATPase subunit
MRLRNLKAKNFCVYQNLNIDFSEGIVGIVGSNGSGKSTLVRAWQFLLTGTTDRNKVRNLTYRSESGTLEGIFEFAGETYVIKRDVVGSSCTLKLPNNEVLKKAEAVNSYLANLLDINPKVFSNHVIIGQGNLDSFLNATPAEFTKELQYLTGTHNCEALRDIISQRIDKFPKIILNVIPEQINREIEALAAAIISDQEALNLAKIELASIDLTKLERKRDEFKTYQYRKTRGNQIEGLRKQINLELDTLAQEIKKLQEDKKLQISELNKSRPLYDDYKLQLANSQQNKKIVEQRASILAQVKVHEKTLTELKAVKFSPLVPQEKIVELELQEREAYSDVHAADTFINTFKKDRLSVCPTCYQKIDNIDELIKEYSDFKDIAIKRFSETSAAAKLLRDTNQKIQLEMARTKQQIDSSENSLTSLFTTLGHLPVCEVMDEESIKSLTTFIATFENLEKIKNESELLCSAKTTKFESLVKNRAYLDEEYQNLGDLTQKFNETQLIEIDSQITTYRILQNKITSLTDLISYKSSQAGELRNKLVDIEETKKRQERCDQFKVLLEKSKSLLHRDNVPRLVIQSYLARINNSYNKFLQILNFPFSVQITDDLIIVFFNQHGDQIFSDELSGGQKMLCSIAFRLAICEQFAQNLGLLVLDEPTAFVDEDNVRYVAEILNNIKSYIKSAGMQIIVVTHDRNLEPVFDQTINVDQLSTQKFLS